MFLDEFKSGLTDVNMDNILQVLMDGPSFNWKFYDNPTGDREQSEISGIIRIGSCETFNPSHPDFGRREKINLNCCFHASLLCLKRFYEGLSLLFEAPQRSVKMKI